MFEVKSFRDTSYNLQFAFAGKMHEWQYNASFGAGNSNYQLKTPSLATSQIFHLIGRNILTSSTALTFQLVQNAVISVQGTSMLAIFNVNRTVSSTSKTKIFTNPSATSGAVIENISLISKVPFIQQSPEIILKSDTDYILRVKNSGAGNATINFTFLWYESNN